ERYPDAEPERISQEEDQERHRRQHEPEAEPVAIGLELVPRRSFADLRPGSLGLKRDVGHGDIRRLVCRWSGRRSAAARSLAISDRSASIAVRRPRWSSWHPWRRRSNWRTCRPR